VIPGPDPLPPGSDPDDADASGERAAREHAAQVRDDAARERWAPPAPRGPADAPRPIGPERLRALREAIEKGTYPNDRVVVSGLVRMFRPRSSPPARGTPPADAGPRDAAD
jgi:hypothetical protein